MWKLEEKVLCEIVDLQVSNGGENAFRVGVMCFVVHQCVQIRGDAEDVDGRGVSGSLGTLVYRVENAVGPIIGGGFFVKDAGAIELSIITAKRGMELHLHQKRSPRIQLRNFDEWAGFDIDVICLVSP